MNVIINLDKPKGISSQQAVTRVKKILGLKKAGHAGTLDPIATGILLVCTGEATKITRFLSDLDKEYIATMKFGEKTDTYDAEGEVIERHESFSLKRSDIENILGGFIGVIEQRPPMYSAVKMGGQPLYKLARKGVMVERPKRTVVVHGIEITGFNPPLVEMKISCSKGTYIRSLCNEIGEALGIGAHIVELRRTRIGTFSIQDSIAVNSLDEIVENFRQKALTITEALSHLGKLRLTDDEAARARNGLSFSFNKATISPGDYVLLEDSAGELFAIGRASDHVMKIERLLFL